MAEDRTRATRARAERALVRLLHELGEPEPFLVVLGGLVPDVLTEAGPDGPEHQGTTDVDVLLVSHVDPEADLGAVEAALERLGFRPDPREDGWRWSGPVDGSTVRLEFLCDLPDHREGEVISPVGCKRLAAANLRGTGYVARDCEWQRLTGQLADGAQATVNVRFAGLAGYLLSKCVVARTRAAEKDYYDLVFVLLNNRAGGPEQAADAIRSSDLSDALAGLEPTFKEVEARFGRPSGSGPTGYATQALLVEPEADEAVLRADAVDAVARFFAELCG